MKTLTGYCSLFWFLTLTLLMTLNVTLDYLEYIFLQRLIQWL